MSNSFEHIRQQHEDWKKRKETAIASARSQYGGMVIGVLTELKDSLYHDYFSGEKGESRNTKSQLRAKTQSWVGSCW